MFQHVVVLRFRAGTTPEERRALRRALEALPGQILQIRRYALGEDPRVVEGNWDFGLIADFATAADYLVYRDHPAHRAVIDQHIKPILAERAVVQIETPD